jgi:hypothetical protein
MYTTTKGITCATITPKLWKGIKKLAYKKFSGSDALFNACWRQYRSYVNGAIDDPANILEVSDWLDNIAAEKVNNPKSKFYIYG